MTSENGLSNSKKSDVAALITNNLSEKDIEDVRIAYQTLPQMISYEGQKPWNALSVYIQLAFVLAAGAIVPSFLPESLNKIVLASVGMFLAVAGIVTTLIWINFDKRYRTITRYWVLSMRDLEENLSNSIVAFRRGKNFAEGKQVTVSGEILRYVTPGRLSERMGFITVYFAFLIVFISLLVLNILRFVQSIQLLPTVL